MVARYKKKRLAEMMSTDESRACKVEGSERMRAKAEVRHELLELDTVLDVSHYWEYAPSHYVLRSALPKDHDEYRPAK